MVKRRRAPHENKLLVGEFAFLEVTALNDEECNASHVFIYGRVAVLP